MTPTVASSLTVFSPLGSGELPGASLLVIHLQAVTDKQPEDAAPELGSHAHRREADTTSDIIVGI